MKTRILVALALASAAASASAASWTVAPGSRLDFHGTYQGESFDGTFKAFTATLDIDAAKPEATAIDVSIDLASVDTQNQERDETLATSDFFDTKKFPKASFKATNCKSAGAGRIACDGTLTIRDQTKPVPFPFTWTETGGQATLVAKVPLDRTAFGVGGGDWADPETIAHEVVVDVNLKLAAK